MRPFLLLTLLLGCAEQGPFVPQGALPWSPLPSAEIDSLWRATEVCSGLQGDWRTLQWFIVPSAQFESPVGNVAGLWDGDHTIYLAEPGYPMWAPWPHVIQHEMLHALLRRPDHPDVFDRCNLRY